MEEDDEDGTTKAMTRKRKRKCTRRSEGDTETQSLA
jgi:hypothetical protein